MNQIHRSLASLVEDIVRRQERPVAVVGDCCHTLGVLAGMQESGIRPAVIWFDAHGDFNTLETSPSGFLGGMPLAMLVGRGDQALMTAVGVEPIPEDKVWLAGARDLDEGESEALEESFVHVVEDVSQLADLPLPDGPIYVHFDTDVVSDREVPAQNYLAKGGPSSEIVERVFSRLADTGQVVAVSMSTWNPELPDAERSQEVCMRVLTRLTERL